MFDTPKIHPDARIVLTEESAKRVRPRMAGDSFVVCSGERFARSGVVRFFISRRKFTPPAFPAYLLQADCRSNPCRRAASDISTRRGSDRVVAEWLPMDCQAKQKGLAG